MTQDPVGINQSNNDPEPELPVEMARDENSNSSPLKPATEAVSEEDLLRSDLINRLALELFNATSPIHGLGSESKVILEKAIWLRNLPQPAARKKPYQAALLFVQSHSESGIREDSQKTLAAVIALDRGKLKRKNLSELELAPEQSREALTLAALLKIANCLDDSHSGLTTIQRIALERDGVWIVVEGPAAAADAGAARQNARVWNEIGYPEMMVLDPVEAAVWMMPYPEPAEKIGILPADPLSEAGRKVMRFQFAQMLRHEQGTCLGEDIESLHDMRVATRRLRAAFEVFGQAFEKSALKPHLIGLRAAGRALGAVRDLDVFMEKAQKYIETLPEEKRSSLDPLLDHWQDERQAARERMLDYLNSAEYTRFKRTFNIFVNTPFAGVRTHPIDEPVPSLVRHLAPALIYERMAAVRSYETMLKDAPIEQLHMLRIEFKKFRYTVEYFREVLGKRAYDVIEAVKQLQDHLGDLNDAQVATQILREFIDTWEEYQQSLPIQERQNIEEVVNYMAARHAERHRLLVSFTSAWDSHYNLKAFRRNLAQAISVL